MEWLVIWNTLFAGAFFAAPFGYIPFTREFVYLFGCAPSILQAHLTLSARPALRPNRARFRSAAGVCLCRPCAGRTSHFARARVFIYSL